ncbi:glycosyltransferase [Fictibacillus fluitans]|uniref:Glycosyltransferase n=1 Tax=Fictibacillus fluitans TaxID=3058422 RepID=A0ABT8HYG4_9BACL|nr:glycosyltransferase [Fictibacillus sp. NE201]MDN4525823.1 glycosyltransferase [Fictibacillus sp. NE201]
MKKVFRNTLVPLFVVLLVLSPITAQAKAPERIQQECLSPKHVKLQGDLRKLWSDHTIWTRSYIVSALAGLKDQDLVLKRLLQNQQDLGNAIKPYYGEKAGNRLANLLTDHILIAGKLVEAVKTGNQADAKKYNTEWYKNADDIARFLSSANPNWTESGLKELLYTHLKFVTDQVVTRQQQDWAGDIKAYDMGEDHIIRMADTFTEGIVKQFPNQF